MYLSSLAPLLSVAIFIFFKQLGVSAVADTFCGVNERRSRRARPTIGGCNARMVEALAVISMPQVDTVTFFNIAC